MRTKSRRKAREAVLQALYEIEIGKTELEDAVPEMLEHAELSEDHAAYAERTLRGIAAEKEEIDARLIPLLTGWDFGRLAVIDRNVLRLATYELFHCQDIPPAVTLDEAIEIAKKYSTAESGRFVNGVLAKVLEESPKAHWSGVAGAVEEERAEPEPEPIIERVEENSPEAVELARVGHWKVRDEEKTS